MSRRRAKAPRTVLIGEPSTLRDLRLRKFGPPRTQAQVAASAGISQSAIAQTEACDEPKLSTLVVYVEAIDAELVVGVLDAGRLTPLDLRSLPSKRRVRDVDISARNRRAMHAYDAIKALTPEERMLVFAHLKPTLDADVAEMNSHTQALIAKPHDDLLRFAVCGYVAKMGERELHALAESSFIPKPLV